MSKQKEFTLAYSPCPNDTFLFYHLVHSNISPDFSISEELMDVENLNEKAIKGVYDITKLSFAAYFHAMNSYDILDSGSALGRGCGPLLIRKKGSQSTLANAKKILSPGKLTTANLLLNLYSTNPLPLEFLRYDKIIPSLVNGEGDLGIIIHEERFTYEEMGMEKVIDLGDWWEKATGYPIPLGCIAIHKRISDLWKEKVDLALKESLDRAWKKPDEPQEYILQNSQNKNVDVVQSHIGLYVNKFTYSLGTEGNQAIAELKERWNSSRGQVIPE